jgi:hypothetical protein
MEEEMSEHTKEPLEYEQNMRGDGTPDLGYYVFGGLDGEPIADVTTEDDARRLVACWNACREIKTEALEAGTGPFLLVEVRAATDRADAVEVRADEAEKLLERVGRIIFHPERTGPKWTTYHRPYMKKLADEVRAFLESKP